MKRFSPIFCIWLCSTTTLATEQTADACMQVLQWLNDGSLPDRLSLLNGPVSEVQRQRWQQLNPERRDLYDLTGSFRVHRDGIEQLLGQVIGGGTCRDEWIEVIDRQNPETYPPAEDEDLRWANWGYRDHLLQLPDQLLVISGRLDAEHNQATLISEIRRDGSKHPLCLLERLPQTESLQATGKRPELCQAVRTGQGSLLEWDLSVTARDPGNHSKLPYLEAAPIPAMDVDLNNDSQLERLARYDLESGAGCGSRSQHLMLLDEQNQVLPADGGNAQLLSRSWGPLSDQGSNLQLINLNQHTYLLARLSWHSETMSLYPAAHPAKPLCQWRERPRFIIKRRWAST